MSGHAAVLWGRLGNRVEHGLGQLVWLAAGEACDPPRLLGWRRIDPAEQPAGLPAELRLLRALLLSIDDAELNGQPQLALPLGSLFAASRGALARVDQRLADFARAPACGSSSERRERYSEALADLLVQLAQLRPTLLLLGELGAYGQSFSVFLEQLLRRSPASRLLVVMAGTRPGCAALASLRGEGASRADLTLSAGKQVEPGQPVMTGEPAAIADLLGCPELERVSCLLDLCCYEAALMCCDRAAPAEHGWRWHARRGEAFAGLADHGQAEVCYLAAADKIASDDQAAQVALVLLRAENQWQQDPSDPGAAALLFDAVGALTADLLDQTDFELYQRLASGELRAGDGQNRIQSAHPSAVLARLFAALLPKVPADDAEQAAKVGLHGLVLAARLGNLDVLAALATSHAGLLLQQGQRAQADALLRWVLAHGPEKPGPEPLQQLLLQAARLAIAGAELARAEELLNRVGHGTVAPELSVACEATSLLAQAALLRGELRAALERGLAAHVLLRNRHDPPSQARCLLLLGRAYMLLGNDALAQDCARRCDRLLAGAGPAQLALESARLQAELAMASGRLPEAIPLLSAALAAHDGMGLEQGWAWACFGTALIGASGGEPATLQELEPLLAQALQRCADLTAALPLLEPRALRLQGLFLAVSGAREQALATLESAQQSGLSRGQPLEQARAALELARLRHIWGAGSPMPLLDQVERILNTCASQFDLRFLQQLRSQVFAGG